MIYGISIAVDNQPKFLVIKFDQRLNFGAQINYIKTKVADRICILNTLSYDKNWRISQRILINIYKSLVRSILDYSNFMISSLSKSYAKALEAIQNNCLRTILHKEWDECPVEELREKAKVEPISERAKTL